MITSFTRILVQRTILSVLFGSCRLKEAGFANVVLAMVPLQGGLSYTFRTWPWWLFGKWSPKSLLIYIYSLFVVEHLEGIEQRYIKRLLVLPKRICLYAHINIKHFLITVSYRRNITRGVNVYCTLICFDEVYSKFRNIAIFILN